MSLFCCRFSFSSGFEIYVPSADVTEKGRFNKDCATPTPPLNSSFEEKTLLTHQSPAYVNSTRCAHHMCENYLSESLSLSLFVLCHGK